MLFRISDWLERIGDDNRLAIRNIKITLGDWVPRDVYRVETPCAYPVAHITAASSRIAPLLEHADHGAAYGLSITQHYLPPCFDKIRISNIRFPPSDMVRAEETVVGLLQVKRERLKKRHGAGGLNAHVYRLKIAALDAIEHDLQKLVRSMTPTEHVVKNLRI